MDKAQRDRMRARLGDPHTRAALSPVVTERDLVLALDALDAAERERDALRTIIEGRTTPPTAAEITAHRKARGLFIVVGGANQRAFRREIYDATDLPAAAERWIALDADGRPCAWPTAAPANGGAT